MSVRPPRQLGEYVGKGPTISLLGGGGGGGGNFEKKIPPSSMMDLQRSSSSSLFKNMVNTSGINNLI